MLQYVFEEEKTKIISFPVVFSLLVGSCTLCSEILFPVYYVYFRILFFTMGGELGPSSRN